jgi:predicted RecB family nuclease
MSRSLSKSRFQKGLQCEKALWLAVHRGDLSPEPGEALQWVFDQGTEVGRLAQRLFPGGVEVAEGHRQSADALATTRRLLAEGATVLYEPAFGYGGAFARVDILAAADDGRWDLYEVKSTARVKDEHITDAAVQAYAVEGSGLALRSINIVHLDTSYVYEGGDYDLGTLFVVADVTEAARAFMSEVPGHLARLLAMLEGPEPEVRIGSACTSPYACDFRAYCDAFLPAEHPVTEVPRLSEARLHALLDAGITCTRDIPDDFPGLSAAQREMVATVKAGEPSVDAAGLARALDALVWPVFHLDFETIAPALPLWPGTRPYHAVPFQYSLHVHGQDGSVEHREYLHPGTGDPRRPLTEQLLTDLGTSGSVLHYTVYERTQLDALAAALPDLADPLAAVRGRLVDLAPLISANTRHPRAAGRSSIKYVLPAWRPDLGYADLSIADGQVASARYLRVLRGEITGPEAERVRDDLRTYCGLDTFAMVCLLEEMLRLAAAGESS